MQPRELVECGVDYITCTAPVGDMARCLLNEAKSNLESEATAGNEVRKWRGLGYAGLSCGGASYGLGPQGCLARLSSGAAKENWRSLFAASKNCSRIDLQFTVKFEMSATEVVADCWAVVLDHWMKHPHLKEPKLVSGPLGPQSISLGSRQSERCGRIYDKGVESKLDYYQDAARFEAEFKGRVSQVIARTLTQKPDTGAEVLPYVLAFFQKYQLSPALGPLMPAHVSVGAKTPDCGRKLAYLDKCIRPMVRALISRGMREEVLEALGLSESGPSGP